MKVNLKKMGAIVAGATLLASSAAFATLMFGDTTLVDENGAPVAKVVLGSQSQPSDGVAAGLIAGAMASAAYKSQTLTADVSGTATCTAEAQGEEPDCAISNEKARLEITIPGTVAAGTWTGENLIGDYLNRELLDREGNLDPTDSDQAYEMGGSDTSENANPFTDGIGGNIGPTEEFMYQIGANQLSTFQPQNLLDEDAGNTYVEMQSIWIKGDNHFDEDPDDVVGDLDFIAYTLKFDGPGGDEIGIPVCTDSEDNDYTYCKGPNGDIDDATETHRLELQFLGEPWIISEMNAPNNDPTTASGDGLVTETPLVNGGSIKLAKESIGGILNQGESLEVNDLKFQLDDLEAHGGVTAAIISVLDANDNILEKDKIGPGNTKEMIVNGEEYRFHVYKVAPGYTFGAKWADVAIFSHEIECEDGQELNSDENDNPNYECALGWKNLDAASGAVADGNPEQADALRTIVIFSDDVEDLTTSGETELEEGDSLTIVENPAAWKLSYKGLDLTSEDRYSLEFELKTEDKEISASKGPYTSCSDATTGDGDVDSTGPTTCDTGTPVQAKCIIYAPYVEVKSGDSGSVFESERTDAPGTLSYNEFYVGLCDGDGPLDNCNPDFASTYEAVMCDGNNDGQIAIGGPVMFMPYFSGFGGLGVGEYDFGLTMGTVMMRTSPSSNDYGFLDYWDTSIYSPLSPDYKNGKFGTEVRYEDIGDGDGAFAPPNGGAILIQDKKWAGPISSDGQLGSLLDSAGWTGGYSTPDVPDFYFAIAEKAGTGSSNDFVDYFIFGVDELAGDPGDATFDFASAEGTFDITSDDEEILYGHATGNPVTPNPAPPPPAFPGNQYYCSAPAGFCMTGGEASGPVTQGLEMVEEGYISERGSVFESMDNNKVEFDMAHRLGRAVWWLGPTETAEAGASAHVVTLGEGESTTIGGITVKVLEITEDVGACQAAGGAAGCVADMSGVSAVIMPNNAPSVDVAVPYTGSMGNLVILDSDAVGVSTLISVGGDRVNSVSADWLSEEPVDWATESVVVREVAEGKILVAGAEKEQTLDAAEQFVSELQKA